MTTREKLFAAMLELSKRYPEWRMGQMISNVATWAKGPHSSAIWDVEDAELLEAIEKHLLKNLH